MSDRPDVVGEPWRIPDGQPLRFGRGSSLTHQVLIWYDAARHRDRVLRFMGCCIACGMPTWSFDDGENDPRGPLGDAAYWSTGIEFNGAEYRVTTCSVCANDYVRWLRAQRLGLAELDARERGEASRYRFIVVRAAA